MGVLFFDLQSVQNIIDHIQHMTVWRNTVPSQMLLDGCN